MKPHYLILMRDGRPYIYRWYLLPYKFGRKFFNIYLHKTVGDDEQALHDHPYLFNISIILRGGYYETTPLQRYECRSIFSRPTITRWRRPGSIIFRGRLWPHRLALKSRPGDVYNKITSWSLFICGPVRQDWGFHTRVGWVNHKELIEIKDGKSQATEKGQELLV